MSTTLADDADSTASLMRHVNAMIMVERDVYNASNGPFEDKRVW